MQISIDIILNYISVYDKCWPVHSTINFNHISKTIEAIMKLHIKMYLSQKVIIVFNILLFLPCERLFWLNSKCGFAHNVFFVILCCF